MLSATAIKLLVIHVTSASAERNWSIWGHIYSDAKRNRLSIESAGKLVSIKQWLNRKSERDPDEMITLTYVDSDEE